MKTKKRVSRKAKRGRDGKGRWLPGVCGNKKGRGAKKQPLPKGLTEQVADAMSEKVAVTDANGKQRMVTVYDAVARRLARGLLEPELKTKDLIPALKWMDNYLVFATMRERAQKAAEPPMTREDLELFTQFKALMAEKTAEMEAEEKERRARARLSKLRPKPKPKPKQPTPRKARPAL